MSESFLSYLEGVFTAKKQKNTSYSLRAFARDLKVSPGTLSKYLNGKREIGPDKIKSMGEILGLTRDKIEEYQREQIKSVSSFFEKDEFFYRDVELKPEVKEEFLSNLKIRMVYTSVGLEGFRDDPDWISQRLGLAREDVDYALEMLFENEILVYDDEGGVKASQYGTINYDDSPVMTELKYKNGLQALETCVQSHRENYDGGFTYSSIFNLHSEDIPEFEQRLRKSMHKIVRDLKKERGHRSDAIHIFTMALAPPDPEKK